VLLRESYRDGDSAASSRARQSVHPRPTVPHRALAAARACRRRPRDGAQTRPRQASPGKPERLAVLGLGDVDEDELYTALDWLGQAQPNIEAALAHKHLKNGRLVLYDLTSSYLEGRSCELARYGYNPDGQRDKPQIVFGLLCAADGCPVAIEVFEGNTADPTTLAAQIEKLRQRFQLNRVVLVGDRGIITAARIEANLRLHGPANSHSRPIIIAT
jgi:hypothetical protein